MTLPPDPTPTTLDDQASAFFARYANGAGGAPKNGWPDFHIAVTKFGPDHPNDTKHLDVVRDVLIRGIRLLQAANGWEKPVAGGQPNKSTPTDRARGEQWRLVMAFAGFEMVARAVLNCKKSQSGLDPADLEKVTAAALLPATCPPVQSPQASPSVANEWLSASGGR
jgi:hypothetical protein